jgi:hypothetical protein
MIPSKTMVGMLILFCVGMIAFSVQAQEEPVPMYLEKEGGEGVAKGEVDTIYTGLAIIYGERIDPPYYAEFRHDTAWINNIPIFPPIKIYYEQPPKVHMSELRQEQRDVWMEMQRDFIAYKDAYGEDGAAEMILDKYRRDPLVAEIEFKRLFPNDSISDIDIRFSDGYLHSIVLPLERSKDGKLLISPGSLRSVETTEEVREGARHYLKQKAAFLKNGAFIVIGFGYEITSSPDKYQENLYRYLEAVARGEISKEQAMMGNPTSLLYNHVFWKEFDLKKDSWLK